MVVEQGKEIKQKQEHLTGMCLALFHCVIIFTGKPGTAGERAYKHRPLSALRSGKIRASP